MTTSSISFSGLATGIDTDSIVEQLVALESLPITRLEEKQDNLSSMQSRIETIASRMDALKDAAEAFSTRSDILATAATSSNTGAVTATATGGAPLGSYSIQVDHLAQAERTLSNTFSGSDTTGLFGTGTLEISIGGDTTTIDVEATDTLETLATKITEAGAGVTAAVIFDGTNYRLQVAGQETGAANDITFTETGVSLGLDDPANELVAAQDAQFSIDGLTMTRSSNLVTGAIAGVTLQLTGETTSAASVTVDRDSESIEELLQTFVDAYNSVQNAISSEFAYTGEARTGDSLSGDSTLRGLQGNLSSAILGSESISGALSTFAELGINTTQTGTIELDTDVLKEKLANSPSEVVNLLAGNSTLGVSGLSSRFSDLVDAYTNSSDGILTDRVESYTNQIRDIDDRIDTMQIRIDKFESTLRSKFTTMETLVSSLNAQGDALLSALSSLTSNS